MAYLVKYGHCSFLKKSLAAGQLFAGAVDEYIHWVYKVSNDEMYMTKKWETHTGDRVDVNIGGMKVPTDLPEPFWTRATTNQLIYSLFGLILGLVCIISGVVLFLHGVTGSTSWTANIFGAESNLSDAAPGVVVFIVGLFIVLITRYDIKVHGTKGR